MSTPTSIVRTHRGATTHVFGASPRDSMEGTFESRSSADVSSKHTFKSYRLVGEYEKPWLSNKAMKSTRWNDLIMGIFILLGLAGAGVIGFFTVWPYRQGDLCLIYEDDFHTLNTDIWTHEVQIDGFGNGAFDWTTTDERNSYVDAEGLHIIPTLTNETTSITNDEMYANYTLNLTGKKGGDGSCTSSRNSSCFLRSDPTEGIMIPPVRSARLSTKGRKSIRYGQVEVVAKLPKGDWLWPAIWMMPEESVYGDWPRSGEIDIMESRGNSREYPEGGRNVYYGTTHWGPTPATDAYWRTTGAKKIRRGEYSDGFHTYGMQWTEKYIYFYVDSRVKQILFLGYKKDKPLYELGQFAKMSENETLLDNPWSDSTSTSGNAPFDQAFYLILNVAVGGTNGWFLDQVGNKPWINDATNAQWTFWSAASEWLPTWGEGDERGMTVKSVRMWQQGKCGETKEL